MKNYESLRTAMSSFEATMQALEILHHAGVDRTGRGCQAMIALCTFLDHTLSEISNIAYDTHGN